MLCITDDAYRRKQVEARWLKMMLRFQVKNPGGWKAVAKAAMQ